MPTAGFKADSQEGWPNPPLPSLKAIFNWFLSVDMQRVQRVNRRFHTSHRFILDGSFWSDRLRRPRRALLFCVARLRNIDAGGFSYLFTHLGNFAYDMVRDIVTFPFHRRLKMIFVISWIREWSIGVLEKLFFLNRYKIILYGLQS